MDKNPFGPVPWDILVFVAITGMGFAFSVQRYVQSHESQVRPSRSIADTSETHPTPITMELGCLEKSLLSERRSGQERELRLSGQFCHLSRSAMRHFGGLRVRNLTTGQESATFFQGDDNTFLTDTLALVEGENQIRLEWKDSVRAPARELTARIRVR